MSDKTDGHKMVDRTPKVTSIKEWAAYIVFFTMVAIISYYALK
jgi:hypothetical protein